MKKALRFPALLAAAALFAAGCATDAARDALTLRVGSYNIRCMHPKDKGEREWTARKDMVADCVERLDCDVIGLQEVKPDQMAFLKEALPAYEFVGDYRCDDPAAAEAAPVCYRRDRFEAEKAGTFWLSESPDERGSVGWDAKYPRVCSYLVLRDRASGRRLCFANCHTDHKGEAAREKGMLLVVERMKEFGAGAPIVFVGDHNCRETEAPAKSVAKVLDNALYVSETRPVGPWRSFNGWQWRDREVSTVEALAKSPEERNALNGSPDGSSAPGGGYRYEECGARIDYIYVSRDVRVLGYRTVCEPRPGRKGYFSDHFPLVADVRL